MYKCLSNIFNTFITKSSILKMTSELSKLCDSIISESKIVSHDFGIPTLDFKKKRTDYNCENDITHLEKKYFNLYESLLKSLDKLFYLKTTESMNKILKSSDQNIENSYQKILEIFNFVKNPDFKEFFVKYNDLVKNTFLNVFTTSSYSIFNATYVKCNNLDFCENNISELLKILYSLPNKKENSSGIAYEFVLQYEKKINDILKTSQSFTNLRSTLNEKLKPKLNKFIEKKKSLKTQEKKIHELKKNEIKNNNRDIEHVEVSFRDLYKKWDYLSRFCDFLPIILTSLHANWFDDKSLFEIIKNCENLSNKLNNYKLRFDVEKNQDLTIDDLLEIDLN